MNPWVDMSRMARVVDALYVVDADVERPHEPVAFADGP